MKTTEEKDEFNLVTLKKARSRDAAEFERRQIWRCYEGIASHATAT